MGIKPIFIGGEGGIALLRIRVNLARVRIPFIQLKTPLLGFLIGGEGGIRTLGALLPNGFRDRPVMTASILLHILSRSMGSGISLFALEL